MIEKRPPISSNESAELNVGIGRAVHARIFHKSYTENQGM